MWTATDFVRFRKFVLGRMEVLTDGEDDSVDVESLSIAVVQRSTQAGRMWTNLADTIERFHSGPCDAREIMGLQVEVMTDSWTLTEQLQLISRTTVLLSVHGAALTLMVFLRPRSFVIEVVFKGYTEPNGMFESMALSRGDLLYKAVDGSYNDTEKAAVTILSYRRSFYDHIIDLARGRNFRNISVDPSEMCSVMAEVAIAHMQCSDPELSAQDFHSIRESWHGHHINDGRRQMLPREVDASTWAKAFKNLYTLRR